MSNHSLLIFSMKLLLYKPLSSPVHSYLIVPQIVLCSFDLFIILFCTFLLFLISSLSGWKGGGSEGAVLVFSIQGLL